MKDFEARLAQLGHWYKPSGPKCADKLPEFILNQPPDREKPRCSQQYPFCHTAMNVFYHTQTNARAPRGTVRLQCKICNRGGIFDVKQWLQDLKRHK